MKEKLNPQEANDWRAIKQQRDICLKCSTELEVMCVNKKEGGSVELDLSPYATVRQIDREITVEQCPINREVVIYEKNKVR